MVKEDQQPLSATGSAPGPTNSPSSATGNASGAADAAALPAAHPQPGRASHPAPSSDPGSNPRQFVYLLAANAMAPEGRRSEEAALRYLQHVLLDTAMPPDPFRAMFMEQAAVAHAVAIHLQGRAARASTPEDAAAFAGAAAKVMAEMRRMILALQEYNPPVAAPETSPARRPDAAARLIHRESSERHRPGTAVRPPKVGTPGATREPGAAGEARAAGAENGPKNSEYTPGRHRQGAP